MDSGYEIIDNRLPETLRKSTFSGYKKTDVYNILFLSIENGKIENACNWLTECICSGYILELWEKLLIFSCNVVTINNPKLSHHLYKKNNLLHNILKCVDKNDRYGLLECRNNIVIRNLYFSIVTILSMSDKKVRYDKYPKLKRNKQKGTSNFNKRRYSDSNQLNINKSKKYLNWTPVYSIKKSVMETTNWYKFVFVNKKNAYEISKKQILEYMNECKWN